MFFKSLTLGFYTYYCDPSGTASLGALINGSGTNASWAGPVTLASNSSIGGSAAGAITINTPIAGPGSLTKAGTNTLFLGGSNSYTGGTIAGAGILQFTKLVAAPLSGATSVSAGGTLAVNVGGVGEFQSSDLTALMSTTTFASNAANIGIDTTNAPGGTFNSPAINGALGFTKMGAGTLVMPASNTYTGSTNILGGTLQVTADNSLSSGALNLGAPLGTGGTLDLTNGSQTFTTLSTALATGATANNTIVGPSETVTFTGNIAIGPNATAANQVSRLNMTGGGNLVVTTGAGGIMRIGGNTGTSSQAATLDLTGLGSANINVSTTGTIGVSNTTGTNTAGNTATLLMPTPVVAPGTPVATLTAGTLAVGDGSGNAGAANQINSLVLGTGLTSINANNVNLGTGGRDVPSLTFASGNGTLILRGAAGGSSRAAFSLGGSGGQTGVGNGTGVNGMLADFTGHSSDLLISTLAIGNQQRTNNQNYDFKFDTGTLDATSVSIGNDTASTGNVPGQASTLTSTLLIAGGDTTIGTGGVTMGTVNTARSGSISAATSITFNGNFNVTGGNVAIGTTGTYSI